MINIKKNVENPISIQSWVGWKWKWKDQWTDVKFSDGISKKGDDIHSITLNRTKYLYTSFKGNFQPESELNVNWPMNIWRRSATPSKRITRGRVWMCLSLCVSVPTRIMCASINLPGVLSLPMLLTSLVKMINCSQIAMVTSFLASVLIIGSPLRNNVHRPDSKSTRAAPNFIHSPNHHPSPTKKVRSMF